MVQSPPMDRRRPYDRRGGGEFRSEQYRERSRSRDRTTNRDHNRGRTDRSRSRDRYSNKDGNRRKDRIDDDRTGGGAAGGVYDRNLSKKSSRHYDDNDRNVNGKSITSPRNRDGDDEFDHLKKKKCESGGGREREEYDDSTLNEINAFLLSEENVDEVQEAEQLALERKRRREEILQKYNAEKNGTVAVPVLAAAVIPPEESAIPSKPTLSNIGEIVAAAPTEHSNDGEEGIDRKLSASELVAATATPNTAEALAAMAIVDSNHHRIDTNNSSSSSSSSSSKRHGEYQADGSEASVPTLNEADALFMEEAAQLQAERTAVELEAHRCKESMPFDMFSSSPSELEADAAFNGAVGRRALREALLEGEDPHLQSNWDDGEGYYKPRIGEMLGERYQTLGTVGKGVFSIVIKCQDTRAAEGAPTDVAIKIIRNNDTMRKAAEKERSILVAIAERDPENRKHCVRLLQHFDFRNHVALVFEYQQMNLRETLKKFGKDVGINIGAVRLYARQLLSGLKHLADLRIVHADIKLDNILCSGDLKRVILCDFGSAFRETDTDNEPTPYLVSRFYRAPEIILGQQYDRAIDLWSVAVCLYELFTGHVMFPGRTNNEMLRLMMVVKGRFPNKQLKMHFRAYEMMQLESHFDPENLRFKQQELDPVTGKSVLRLVDINQPTKELSSTLRGAKAGSDDGRLVSSLSDMLEKMLILDPSKRCSVVDALKHPFFTMK